MFKTLTTFYISGHASVIFVGEEDGEPQERHNDLASTYVDYWPTEAEARSYVRRFS